jgi:excisionase family DNA binding protein
VTVPLTLTVGQAAELLQCSERLVYELIARGVLPAVQLGRRRLIPRAAIEAVIERCMEDFDPDAVVASIGSRPGPAQVPPYPPGDRGRIRSVS